MTTTSRPLRVVGWVLTVIVSLFLAFDAITHILVIGPVRTSTAELGYPPDSPVLMGVLELIALVLLWLPPTRVLGALLLTAYLGGAVSAQVRIEAPLATNVLSPVYTAVLLWAGLWCRDAAVRAVLPIRRG